jgi:ATP-binding cassette, subfamily B, bacterial PglK
MIKIIIRLWGHLSKKKKVNFLFFFMLMLLGSLVEVISLGSVLPFLSAFSNTEIVMGYPVISDILIYYDLTEPDQVILSLTVVFITAVLIAGGIRLLLLFLGTKLSFSSGHELSVDVYKRTLYQPYEVHMERNSSEIIAGITTKISNVTNVLNSSVAFLNSLILIVIVSLALVLLNPVVALLSATIFIFFYGLVTWLVHGKLNINSQHVSTESTQIVKALQEGMNGIRDIILDSSQNIYCVVFGKSDLKLKNAQSSNIVISASPRFVMESFGMVVIAVIAFSLYTPENGIANSLPLLGALAIGAQRMLPASQQCFSAWSSIIGSKASLLDVLELLDQPESFLSVESDIKPLSFERLIELKEVSFRYGINQHNTLSSINISLEKGLKIGFIGSTGSGKSTAIDLIMGLLKPTKGEIVIDGLILKDKHLRRWQKSIAHVPQSVYLSDATIAENITFSTPADTIDQNLLNKVAAEAQLLNFIESTPKKYNTNVGESGTFLSGGQVQRIGIARALYKKANILILDEATSALDSVTEKQVMKAISESNKDLTIIIISHRLSTIKDCDVIYEFESGKVISKGTYNELLKSSSSFQKMTKI